MKPIIMSTEDVQAILAGRKSQTRRVIKPQPDCPYAGTDHWHDSPRGSDTLGPIRRIPYAPGDILWVRETWMPCASIDSFLTDTNLYAYKADYVDGDTPGKWRPSIHMPKEAARLFLRVTDVRVERVQDISVEDVVAEGAGGVDNEIRNPDPNTHESIRAWNRGWAQHVFSKRWDTRSAKRGYGWDSNPFVWVVSFERLE